jgi:hypothetical protein
MNEALQAALSELARDGVERVDPAAVETLARVVWHTDEPLPDLNAFAGEHREDVARLVGRFAVFSIVRNARRAVLLEQAREALGLKNDAAVLGDHRVDRAFIERFWDTLNPLQTRQYAYDIGRPYA